MKAMRLSALSLLIVVSCFTAAHAQWTRISEFDSATVNALAASGSSVACDADSAADFLNAHIWVSQDTGATWKEVFNALSTGMVIYDSSLVSASGGDGILVSTDLGAKWSNGNGFAVGDKGVEGEAVCESGGDFYANYVKFELGDGGTGVYMSTDGGSDWTLMGTTPNYIVPWLVVSGQNLFAGQYVSKDSGKTWIAGNGISNSGWVRASASTNSAVFEAWDSTFYMSTDEGANWSVVKSAPYTKGIHAIAARGDDVFIGGDNGLFLSTDDGTTWTAIDSGLGSVVINSLSIDVPYLFAGTSNGLWRMTLSQVIDAVAPPAHNTPVSFRLFQNYPNPFNPSTDISYQLPARSFVTLRVYHILGEKLRTLVSMGQSPGVHSVAFNAVNLPSGVYFYRIQAGNYTATKKLMLVK